MSFWGQISLNEDQHLLDHFDAFMEDIGSPGLLRLGTGRTRGMGKVTLDVVAFDEEQVSFETFAQRLASFDALLHERARFFEVETHPYGYFFALTLHAPLLLCDELLRYHSTITPATLEELLDHKMPGLTRLFYASSMRRVTGWQELWGMPRTGEQAIESGSVFLFACTHPPDEALLKKLFELEEQGLGKRRIEGFGRIGVSDQFHQHIQQEKEQPL
jgi:CRISPR-associated protein Csx10